MRCCSCSFRYLLCISVHFLNEIHYAAFAFDLRAYMFTVACLLFFLFENTKCVMKLQLSYFIYLSTIIEL